jgi:predicted TPR repeat methyltransferase
VFEAEAYSRLAGVYDEIVVDPSHARWARYLHDLWRADERRVVRVLDVCCGTGLLAAELVPLGYSVVGVDASAAMLARARDLLGPDVALVEQSLPELGVDGVFDAAVSTFDGLNYLTPADFAESLAAVALRLRPGGWFVFDLHTDAMMAFTVANPVVEGEADGQRFVIESSVDVAARTCATSVEITRAVDGESFFERHQQYFHSDADVRRALAGAGLTVQAVTDEYTDNPVDGTSLRATWIARRAG